MEKTGLVGIFKFADALIGWVPGGFAYATLLAAVFLELFLAHLLLWLLQ